MKAEIQEKASPKARARATAPNAAATPAWKRNPTRVPTTSMRQTTNRLRAVSDRVRPASTAERAMGRDRKRSTMPRVMSSARPTPVWVEPKITVWARIPAIR
jgi:hypothetical protein